MISFILKVQITVRVYQQSLFNFLYYFFPGPYASRYTRGRYPGSSSSGGCSLDASWSGEWFEYGERRGVRILDGGGGGGGSEISHKGECVMRKGDKYIFKDG